MIIDTPEKGYYKMRLVAGGPAVPVHIERFCTCTINGGDDSERHVWRESCDRYPRLGAIVEGSREEEAEEIWSYCAGNQITHKEYRFINEQREWLKRNAPDDPLTEIDKPIDVNEMPSLF